MRTAMSPSRQPARSWAASCFGRTTCSRRSPSSQAAKNRASPSLLLAPPTLLLMDEPTTHLDIPSIDALIRALSAFGGTLIFISHDVHFIRAIAKGVLHNPI